MRAQVLLAVALLALLLVDHAQAEKVRKFKKWRHHKRPSSTTTTTTTTESEAEAAAQDESVFAMLEEDEKAEEQEEAAAAAEEAAESAAQASDSTAEEKPAEPAVQETPKFVDPCGKKHCGAGRVCQATEEGEPECVCIQTCPEEVDPRRKVCSNTNETWGSDCEVYQMRCWCDKEGEQCRGEQYKHLHIEYYGQCRDQPDCSTEEMEDFPRRMRDWLFNIMRDLADRDELTPHYLKMEREAETNMTKRWTNAAVWKWCDLDGHPHDRSVSRHELFPIRAPLMSLEHCIAPFLNGCDVDDDHRITLTEWGACLQLDPEELEEACDDVRGEEE